MGGFRQAQEYNQAFHDAVHAAATATEQRVIFIAPCKCRVIGVKISSDVAVTGDNTNTTNLNIVNKGATGAGTTEVANLDPVTGVNLAAFDAVAIPLNATYLNGVDMAEGDVLTIQYEKVASGVLIGPSHIQVDFVPV